MEMGICPGFREFSMRKILILCLSFVMVGLFSTGSAQEDKKPNLNRIQWTLTLDTEDPKSISIEFGDKTKNYWYQVFTLTNNTIVDIPVIYLDIRVTTDTAREYIQVPNPVAQRAIIIREGELEDEDSIDKAIKKLKEKNKYLTITEINGKGIKIKESKQCIVVFNRIDPNTDRLIVHYGGLRSKIRIVDGKPVKNIHVFRLYYDQAGDEFDDWRDKIKFVKRVIVKVENFNQTREDINGVKETWTQRKLKEKDE